MKRNKKRGDFLDSLRLRLTEQNKKYQAKINKNNGILAKIK